MKSNRAILPQSYVHVNSTASTALTTLEGLLDGITCDHKLVDLERQQILSWVDRYSILKNHPAVGSVFDYLAEALSDEVLSISEAEDLRWMIKRNQSSFYDVMTQQIQYLTGMMAGISSDKTINRIEQAHLWDWLNKNENLKGIFPFDEIYSLLVQIGMAKPLSKVQNDFLVGIFQEFLTGKSLGGISLFLPYSVDPEIVFEGKRFCITGVSKKMVRRNIEALIAEKAGQILSGVSQKIDYLVVCGEANIAWTHASYGRKIEEAVKLRKQGCKLAIIAEKDLWDQIQD